MPVDHITNSILYHYVFSLWTNTSCCHGSSEVRPFAVSMSEPCFKVRLLLCFSPAPHFLMSLCLSDSPWKWSRTLANIGWEMSCEGKWAALMWHSVKSLFLPLPFRLFLWESWQHYGNYQTQEIKMFLSLGAVRFVIEPESRSRRRLKTPAGICRWGGYRRPK